MAKITYTLLDREFNSIPENENYSSADLNLIDSFEINKNYKPERHYIESHFYSLNNKKIFSVYDYKLNTSTETSAEGDITSLSLEPEKLSIENGFTGVDHKIVFHFLNDLYTYTSDKQRFYINSISQDRTEILLYSDKIDVNRIINITEDLKEKISNESYFEEYWLNLGDNDLFIVTNIDVFELDDKYTVALKLYEPLPERFELKYEAQLVEKISDSLVVEVQVDVEEEPEVFPKLRQANFDVELDLNTPTPTQYFNYDELFSYSNLNSNREIFSYINENSVDININYSNYENFINFSSAKERLENFKYKVQLLQTYQSSKDQISNSTNNSGSSAHYDNLIKGVVDNFDHYEKFLYFESGSNSWPKSTSVKPHVNLHSTSTEAISWYANQLTSASNYDVSNYDLLANALPSYIAEDTNNSSAVLFTHMIGQHFDNLWIYTKAVTDKYNNDNRVDVGISKDLVRDALTSLGTKLYNSAEGTNDLFRYIISDTYDSGSIEEIVNTFIEVPNIPTDRQPISRKNYEGELYKRIYHNLPFLLKSKGTERGLRALINCFGIPSDFLTIKQYGGQIIGSDKFLGYEGESTSSIGKVRYETRASGSVGRVLTQDKSIQKTEEDKTQDIHRLEVGFSPSDNINDYILSQLPSSFNIDDYIGDPRDLNKNSYTDLFKEAHRVLHASVERTQLNDFVRILKFYDNVLFKMIKDFIPAKATLDAGIIIKPHILNRSKVKSPDLSGTRPEYTGSIDTAFVSGSQGGVYDTTSITNTTAHTLTIPTLLGSTTFAVDREEPMFNGELSGSHIEITDGELNSGNKFKTVNIPNLKYDIIPVDQSVGAVYTSFNASTANESTDELACGMSYTLQTYYHDGELQYPELGDRVFPTINSAVGLDGNGRWYRVPQAGIVIAISGSADLGKVYAVTPCSNFDSTPPSGYTAAWSIPSYINAATSASKGFYIYGATESDATYHATASLESDPSTKVYATGTVGMNSGAPNYIVTKTINTTALADGENVFLDVTLADANGNMGAFAPNVSSLLTLTASLKDTNIPTGYTTRFTTSNYNTNETSNTTGNFYFVLENIPPNTVGTWYFNLTSTGGGTSYSNSGNLYNSSTRIFGIGNNTHQLTAGTVTLTSYIVDSAGNQGPNVTDQIQFSPQSGNLYVIGNTNTSQLTSGYQQFSIGVNVEPNYLNWSLIKSSWISISGASGTGDDSSINVYISANTSSNNRFGSITLRDSNNTSLDAILIVQAGENCIAPHTLITMGDGTSKPAGELQVGDEIRTKHEKTLEKTYDRITRKEVYTSPRVKVYIGDKEIVCSPGHRFYVDNASDWVAVTDLKEGDTLSGKTYIKTEEHSDGDVIKLSVANSKTYISEGILSHNVKGDDYYYWN